MNRLWNWIIWASLWVARWAGWEEPPPFICARCGQPPSDDETSARVIMTIGETGPGYGAMAGVMMRRRRMFS